ncbi:hypothetical protein LTR91_005211 [Friedmanniomyces endolithicus]|uniref:Uncharacterized protein n=1 Tax=Friedmanniomyces endolithicus TaxID=329885 RepID=A0AAN6QYB3_9PEZI|nr:hypothetical protein LTR94_000254 [Friedmanniomyces endolithicus]KAK0792424.1 hypothetical protein LTR75_011473 [Friedmanniomyces endolithicus]KAK0814967.1 hypothetical protein LTR59_000722 [Friedmanniomyces endolithicus]KAK0815201.1 hypothetical protein LTR38_002495 [Friedmanniomyces endolithicus]KAK0874341.1 hypothetical protein LTS02_000257 [Friedmanniomyces endolithicus]
MPKAVVDAHLKEAELIYCCTRSLRGGLRSGLIGSLQKHGYTEENRRIMVKAFDSATQIIFYLNGKVEHYPKIRDSKLGHTVFIGLFLLLKKMGYRPEKVTICTEVTAEFQQMELSTLEETLGVESRRKAKET